MVTPQIRRPRLRTTDVARLAVAGMRTRKLRASLSALGIGIGVAAIVAVLGISASASSGLQREISQLGTNLLTVANGQTAGGDTAELPLTSPSMIARVPAVTQVADTGMVNGVNVFRTPLIPIINTNALSVRATNLSLPRVVGTSLAAGRFLDQATATEPVAVLGAAAAIRLGVDQIYPRERIWVVGPGAGQWFYLAGVLRPATLAPEIDSSVLVGYPAAERYLGFDLHPSQVYVRARVDRVNAVHDVLAPTADPEHPEQVTVSRPSDALVAQLAAKRALNSLFIGLGAVSLLVGAIGIGNVMFIGVLERRSEIGLRRALGARRSQIRVQFLSEAMLLALFGGTVGVGLGALATAIYAHGQGVATVVPNLAWTGGLGAALVIGAAAGLLPAVRAARMSPTQALWAV